MEVGGTFSDNIVRSQDTLSLDCVVTAEALDSIKAFDKIVAASHSSFESFKNRVNPVKYPLAEKPEAKTRIDEAKEFLDLVMQPNIIVKLNCATGVAHDLVVVGIDMDKEPESLDSLEFTMHLTEVKFAFMGYGELTELETYNQVVKPLPNKALAGALTKLKEEEEALVNKKLNPEEERSKRQSLYFRFMKIIIAAIGG
jgi:hypothetical protein